VTGDQRSTSARREPPGVQPEPGTAVVPLSPGRVLRRCRAAGADVVVTVLAGAAHLTLADGPPRRLDPGESAGCPRGVAFRLAADGGTALLRVAARPAGPEVVLALLAAARRRTTRRCWPWPPTAGWSSCWTRWPVCPRSRLARVTGGRLLLRRPC
jgi:quercetin dioxygenase-like cupin family protein